MRGRQYRYRGEEGKREKRVRERGHWDPQPFQVTIKMALLLPSVFLSAFLSAFLSTQLTSLYSSLSSRTHVRSFYPQTSLLAAVRHGSPQSTAACSTARCKLVSPLYLHEKPALSSRILQCTVRDGGQMPPINDSLRRRHQLTHRSSRRSMERVSHL